MRDIGREMDWYMSIDKGTNMRTLIENQNIVDDVAMNVQYIYDVLSIGYDIIEITDPNNNIIKYEDLKNHRESINVNVDGIKNTENMRIRKYEKIKASELLEEVYYYKWIDRVVLVLKDRKIWEANTLKGDIQENVEVIIIEG